jgi:hypothetical protein
MIFGVLSISVIAFAEQRLIPIGERRDIDQLRRQTAGFGDDCPYEDKAGQLRIGSTFSQLSQLSRGFAAMIALVLVTAARLLNCSPLAKSSKIYMLCCALRMKRPHTF